MEIKRASFLIRGAMVYNGRFKKFMPADVSVSGGKLLYIDSRRSGAVKADETVNTEGLYMVPGLIDIHTHIESSILTLGVFCRRLVGCGVITIVSEPHEMANVNGMQGMLNMIRAGENSPVDIFHGVPSCMPSISSELKTTGDIIVCKEMEGLKENPWVACVGEVMNYRTIVWENQLEITRLLKQLREKDRIFPTEGHCPALLGLDLAELLCLNISGDCMKYSLGELEQRLANGTFTEIQEKMLRREVLGYIREHGLEEHFCFVTDDVVVDTLYIQRRLDALVRRAMELGTPAEQAVYSASFIPAKRMNLLDQGTITPGKIADLLLFNDLDTFAVSATYKNGKCIRHRGQDEREQPAQEQHGPDGGQDMCLSEPYYYSIHLEFQEQSRSKVPMELDSDTAVVRIMEIQDGSTKTKEIIMRTPVGDSFLKWGGMGCLLAAMFERRGRGQVVRYGLVTGDCCKWGIVVISYAHGCHNILATGTNPADVKFAPNHVTEMQGGMVAANGGGIQAGLPPHVGGILSDRPAKEVGTSLVRVREAMTGLGCRHYDPTTSFCTLMLPASPALKLTDKGLVDAEACKTMSLKVEGQRAQP